MSLLATVVLLLGPTLLFLAMIVLLMAAMLRGMAWAVAGGRAAGDAGVWGRVPLHRSADLALFFVACLLQPEQQQEVLTFHCNDGPQPTRTDLPVYVVQTSRIPAIVTPSY
eukprot:3933897-Rhodomonas_salina.1